MKIHKKIFLPLCCAAILVFPINIFARPQSLEQLKEIEDHLAIVPLEGSIVTLYRPNYDTVMEANLKLSANEPVFIVQFPDMA